MLPAAVEVFLRALDKECELRERLFAFQYCCFVPLDATVLQLTEYICQVISDA